MSRSFIIVATALWLVAMTVSVEALIIRDQCNQTSGDGQGHSCPPGDYLLIRPQYPSGVCGDWMCCPANGDGSYNCEKAVNPTSSVISGHLKNLLGPRATVLSPGSFGTGKQPTFQTPGGTIQRRGIDEESPVRNETTPGEVK
ncbi:hypothetical protein YTPLAS18_07510 [Nitrospira sp.]|nr:hypothetical protein YTPLAS18_07510 [Nitrospira sp.]